MLEYKLPYKCSTIVISCPLLDPISPFFSRRFLIYIFLFPKLGCRTFDLLCSIVLVILSHLYFLKSCFMTCNISLLHNLTLSSSMFPLLFCFVSYFGFLSKFFVTFFRWTSLLGTYFGPPYCFIALTSTVLTASRKSMTSRYRLENFSRLSTLVLIYYYGSFD